MCLACKSLIAKGIGEQLQQVAHMPKLSMVLVNPLKTVSTPQIFKQLASKTNAPMPAFNDSEDTDWRALLSQLRNDLETPAKAQLPQIDTALAALNAAGAWLSRMSGSGATCYGLFDNIGQASAAAQHLRERFPLWFIQETETI
jgi:4-diphosphocytidyl-2-C-methyl-D-erythritol kinase